MNEHVNNPFPAIVEGKIGTATVQTVSARDLHAFLEVGKDFATWIKDRIAAYGFNEHSDFEMFEDLSSPNLGSAVSAESGGSSPQRRSTKSQVVEKTSLPKFGERVWGGQNRKEYALTLDMAKEVAMVERNEQGRTVRRYFIACERQMMMQRSISVADLSAEVRKVVGGIIKSVVHSELEPVKTEVNAALATVTAIANVVQPAIPVLFRHGKTAGQIWHAAGFRPIKITSWFSNRLREAGCLLDGCADMGLKKCRLFDPDKAETWLRNGGRLLVEQKIAERTGTGQGVIPFPVVKPPSGTGSPPSA